MVETYPFKGLTYNKEKIKKPDDVMSPPYDIISDEMQKNLYNKHPQNFVRLILGKINTNDSNDNNRYTRAKEFYDLWQKEKILMESITPAIYPYKIEYAIEDKIRTILRNTASSNPIKLSKSDGTLTKSISEALITKRGVSL